jgi:homoserine kinase type II
VKLITVLNEAWRSWEINMNVNEAVFVVHHIYGEAESETYKLVGVFESEQGAQSAVDRLRLLPGFCDYPDGFSIDAYKLNEIAWSEGFGIDQIGAISDR